MMTSELTSLVWVTALTAVMWVPYILNTIMVRGLVDAVGYPAAPKPLAPWADRLKKAHYNAIENLVVFATLVLVLNAAGMSNTATVMAAEIYFWARLVHAVVYAMGVPWLRTLAFAASWACLAVLLLQLL